MDAEEKAYFGQVIGARIVAFDSDDDSVTLFLSDGHTFQIIADEDGGFQVEINGSEVMH